MTLLRVHMILILTLFCSASRAEKLTGTVTNVTPGRSVAFRDANTNFIFNWAELPANARALLSNPESKSRIIEVDVPSHAITTRIRTPQGLRSDCSELPMSMDELEKIIDSPNVNGTVDFLRALPEGTFEGYTFVTNSLSAQRGEGESRVRPMWPRVLRTNATGSITFSWTCDPNSETYNQVELLYVENGELKARSYELDKPAGTRGPAGRIDPNPTSCATCHSTGVPINGRLSMKHIWPEYFSWSDCKDNRGIQMYGSFDDAMAPGEQRAREASHPMHFPEGCGGEADVAFNERHKREFNQFRELQKDNPCYNLLPKPENPSEAVDGLSYAYYPYHAVKRDNDIGLSDYSLETNTRFTDMYAHHNSQRILKLLQESPDYEKLKYYLVMEEAGCLVSEDYMMVKRLVPQLPLLDDEEYLRQQDPRNDQKLLYTFSLYAGLRAADWSLAYSSNTDYNVPSYNAVMPADTRSRDLSTSDVVAGLMLQELAKGNSSLKGPAESAITRGIEQQFGGRHACIDKLGGGISNSVKGHDEDLCKALRAANEAHVRECLREQCGTTTLEAGTSSLQAAVTISIVEQIREDMAKADATELNASIERGRAIVQSPTGKGHCVNCHSRTESNAATRPNRFLFVPGENLSSDEQDRSIRILRQRYNEGFLSDLESNLKSGSMPADTGFTNMMSDQEVTDVMNYFKSFAR